MDLHVVTRILLHYYRNVQQWSLARCLNSQCKHIVDHLKYDADCWGRRTFIRPHFCEICECSSETCGSINYRAADFVSVFHITHCQDWQCKISAIRSMLNHCKTNNLYPLREPFQESEDIIIPRSDGSETLGRCNPYYLCWRDKWLVYTYWNDENEYYTKLVPLSHYTQTSPKFIFDKM